MVYHVSACLPVSRASRVSPLRALEASWNTDTPVEQRWSQESSSGAQRLRHSFFLFFLSLSLSNGVTDLRLCLS